MILLTFHHTLTCPLFTSGSIRDASGEIIPYAVTPTTNMLPAGRYRIAIVVTPETRRRQLGIIPASINPPGWHPEHGQSLRPLALILDGHSFRSAKGLPSIIIGEELIPGVVINSRQYYDRLFERIEKAEVRHDPVDFYITHANVSQRKTPRHWLLPAHHNLPPTTIRVEANGRGEVTVYEGDNILRQYLYK